MQRIRKWTAFFSVVAVLVTFLMPVSSLAAGSSEAAVDTENTESRAVRAAQTVRIEKDQNGSVTSSSDLQDDGNAVVLVNNRDLTLELSVADAPEGTVGYQWTRRLEVKGYNNQMIPGALDQIPAGEDQASYEVRVAKGDMTVVGVYTYTCDMLDQSGDPISEVSFQVETLGVGLAAQTELTADPMLVADAMPDGTRFADLRLEAKLDQSEISELAARVNAGPAELAEPDGRGRGVYTWTSEQLGSNFDVYPYDAQDQAGAWYDFDDSYAWFQMLVSYDGGTKYANQVAAGANRVTVTASGAGIDPARSSVTFTRTVIPQLVPSPENAAPYEATVTGNSAVYSYYITDMALDGQLVAKWQMSLTPSNVEYVWVRTEDGVATQERTTQRALDFTIQAPASKSVDFAVTPTGQIFEGISQELMAQVGATFRVDVQKDIPDPVLTDLKASLNNGTSLRVLTAPGSTEAYQTVVAKGNDLIFTADANAGPDVGGPVTYSWTLLDPLQENATEITADTEQFLLEEDGARLRILNVQLPIDRSWIRLTIKNRGDRTVTRDVQIIVDEQAVKAPVLKTKTEPAMSGGTLTVTEGTPFRLYADDVSGISGKSLAYKWMMTTAAPASQDQDSVWTEAPGVNDVNPYEQEAVRSRNDVPVYYRCIVTNTSGRPGELQAVSRNFRVQVEAPKGTVTVKEPQYDLDYTIEHGSGSRLKFDVEAESDAGAELEYQWYVKEVGSDEDEEVVMYETDAISGATESTYSPGRIPNPGYYVYKCKVYNPAEPSEFAWSPAFRVWVEHEPSVPVITTMGETTLGTTAGGYLRLRIQAHSTTGEPLSYQWQRLADGGWEDVDDATATRPSMTVSNLKTEQSGSQYRCVVTNMRQGTANVSRTFTIRVWRAEDMPVITVQPQGWTLQSGTVEAAHPTLKTEVSVANDTRYEFNWQHWNADLDAWEYSDLDQLDVNTDTSAASTLEFTDTDAANGRYRCEVINRAATAEGATVYTNEVSAYVMMRHVPTVTQAPRSQSAMVGKTVTLRVNAAIFPAEELTYTWRVQEPDSSEWRNCDDRDGSGYDSAVFITKAFSNADANQKYHYRCVVEGAVNHVQAPANTTAVVQVYPVYPELDPAPTSKLTIKVDEETGERYLRGYMATRDGLTLTVQGVWEDVIARNLEGSGGKYTLEVRDKDGNLLRNADDRITTGSTVTLLLTNEQGANGVPVPADELTIVIQGDVQGTGRMTIGQLVSMANYLVGEKDLPAGPVREATDINGNGKCDIGDLTMAARLLNKEDV